MTFNEILAAVRAWFADKTIEHAFEMKFEVVQDTSICFHAFLETENSISELIVNEPDFAPYRFVSFQVMSAKQSPQSGPIFSYYDNASCTIRDITAGLNAGIEIAVHC